MALYQTKKPTDSSITIWLNTFFWLIKSRTLVYAFAVSSFGTFLIASGGVIGDISIPIRVITSSYLIALATYVYNDITDKKSDNANGRNSVHYFERTQHKATIFYIILFFLVSITLAFSINLLVGIASLVFFGLAVAYSHPRTRLKDKFVVKTAITAAGAMIASTMGYLAHGTFSYLGFISSLIAFLFYFILGPLGDISDLKGDKIAGRRTFPIAIGIRRTFVVTILATVIMATLFLLSNIFLGTNLIGTLLGIGVTSNIIISLLRLPRIPDKLQITKCRRSIRYCIFATQISLLIGSIAF